LWLRLLAWCVLCNWRGRFWPDWSEPFGGFNVHSGFSQRFLRRNNAFSIARFKGFAVLLFRC
jgi:hypothetical protein